MPELAEVEIARRNLSRWWRRRAERVEIHDRALTTADPDTLTHALTSPIASFGRRGKYLFVRTTEQARVVFHFRMTGKIVVEDAPQSRFARLSWWVPAAGWLTFKDARRLGEVVVLAPGERYAPFERMGPEPEDLTADALQESLGSTRRRLKDVLLDQSVVAGVGNIAISEVFWQLRLPPTLRAPDVTRAQVEALVSALPRYFEWLIDDQQADEIVYLGEGKARNPFTVYKREGEACPRCEHEIGRAVFGGRSTYWCPRCQGALEAETR